MRRLANLMVLIGLVLALAACGGSNKYRVMERKTQFTKIPMRVIVTDLDDKRPFEQASNAGITMIPIFGLWGGYFQDRHDDFFAGVTVPFRQTLAKQMAKRLADAGVFDEVRYVAPDAVPPRGEYDLMVTGTLKKLQSRGSYTRYGLSFLGDLLWELGLPKFNRRWVIEADFRMLDGYTNEQIGKDKEVAYSTSRKWFTTYFNRGRTTDLERKTPPVYDEYIDWVWESLPKGDDNYWVELRKDGQVKLAQAKLADEMAKKGTPPTFSFLAPTEGARVRGAMADLRWSITAPGGLKSIMLVVNNQPVTLPIDMLSLANAESAPKSIAAQDIKVPVKMGSNKLEALVIDHRGNETRATSTLTRIPAELTPPQRHALLIGTGSSAAQEGVARMKEVLVDPLIGQFEDQSVVTLAKESLTRSDFDAAIRSFGNKPLAGNLALIHISADGDWTNLTIGDGSLSLNDAVATIASSLATNEVVLMLDINWKGSGGDGDIASRIANLPGRWAVLAAQPNGEQSVTVSGKALFSEAFAATLRGPEGSTARLTLERMLDAMILALEDGSGGKLKPQVYGRYNPSISMAERE